MLNFLLLTTGKNRIVHKVFFHIVGRGDVKMGKRASPLKLGNETYGILKIEEAFLKALESYFIKQKESKPPYK